MNHAIVLETLLKLSNVCDVHLVARKVVPEAKVSRNRIWVFIPDLHLLTKKSAKLYTYSFMHDESGAIPRNQLLSKLGSALAKLRVQHHQRLSVVQLGDFIDVWRENRVAEIEDLRALATRVLKDNPAPAKYLANSELLNSRLVVGNHDHVGVHSLMWDDKFRKMKVAHVLPTNGSVIATHGDLFDPIEKLPDKWSRWGSRFTMFVGSGVYDLSYAKRILEHDDIPKSCGVKSTHRLLKGAQRYAKKLRQGDKEVLKSLRLRKQRPVSIFVIGHSHKARLTAKSGLVIMDCGAWLERCKVGGKIVPSCQIGVIGQSDKGADVRIYQLTPASSK